MPKKNSEKDYGEATLASVKKEMAKPRVAESARKKSANLALSVVGPKPVNRPVVKQLKHN